MTVLEFDGTSKHFPRKTGVAAVLSFGNTYVKAVNDVSLAVDEGRVLGLVGESGCGKTTLAKLVLRLHDPTDGEILLHGRPLDEYDRTEFYRSVQMIFQDPFKSLNPRMTVEEQLLESLRIHDIGDEDARIRDAMEFARLTPVESYLENYPHELSGGEKQRVAIASAIILEPSVIIADEPVSMLDVSVRAGILELFRELADESDTTILYISHDLATVRYVCDELAVMYLGKVMEYGPTLDVISEPTHPYTERLVSATPVTDPTVDRERVVNERQVPDPIDLPSGCVFKSRCRFAVDDCDDEDMSLRPPAAAPEDGERLVACHRAVAGDIDWDDVAGELP